MLTTAIYNFKGGAFKTTASHHLAAGLAIKGYKVLVVDTDPQGHVSLLFGIEPTPKLYDYLVRPKNTPFKEAAMFIPKPHYASQDGDGMLFLIPGNDETASIGLRLTDPTILFKRLKAVSQHFDYCFIDTPPTPSLMSILIYTASDAVLYPTMCANLHVDGLVRAMEVRKEADTLRKGLGLPSINVLGIQPAIFRQNTLEHEQYYEWLKSNYNNVWQPINQSVLWEEAARERMPVFTYAPDSKSAKQAWRMVNTFEKVTQHEQA